MDTQVDIQMPIKQNSFIVGDVIQRLLIQDAAFTFYVDAGEDFGFSKDQERLLELIASRPEDVGRNVDRIKKSTRITFKRDRLRLCGNSPYVYLADSDIQLPPRPVFGSMIRSLKKYPQLGALGLCCIDGSEHVSCASMMLRRQDFRRIGKLRESTSCACSYIGRILQEFGLEVIPVKAEELKPRHLTAEYHEGYPDYNKVTYQMSADRILHRSFLENTSRQFGTRFKLFIDD